MAMEHIAAEIETILQLLGQEPESPGPFSVAEDLSWIYRSI